LEQGVEVNKEKIYDGILNVPNLSNLLVFKLFSRWVEFKSICLFPDKLLWKYYKTVILK